MNLSAPEREIINLLNEFGLAANLGKTYVALLKNNPATGYEICTQSGVPRSAIYSVLSKLESIGIVNSIGDSPKRYVPISPSGLIEHFSQLHSDRTKLLTDAFTQVETAKDAFNFWHLHGYRNLIFKLREAISSAKEKLFLSIWSKDLLQIDNELKSAENRGISITIFSFTKLSKSYGHTISYNLDEKKLQKVWNPKVILIEDQKNTIMGSTKTGNNNSAIWTDNKAIMEIASNNIILDITLAAQRLKFDPNPIVRPLMANPDLNLDDMLQ